VVGGRERREEVVKDLVDENVHTRGHCYGQRRARPRCHRSWHW
jgi:hypothetical protein